MASQIILPSESIPGQAEVPRQLTEDEINQLRRIEAEALDRCGLPPRRPQEDTLLKQTDQKEIIPFTNVVEEFLAVEVEGDYETDRIGFMMRALIQATLPHRRVNGTEFSRKNGGFTLTISAPARYGLPYGSLPRLIMTWITTTAVKTKNRKIELGDNLSGFMRELGLVPTGGRWGSITRLRDQMMRLLASTISCSYEDGQKKHIKNFLLIEEADIWWNPTEPDHKVWQSTLSLSQAFYDEIITTPVPVRMSTLEALKGSSLALDVYAWLTYRNFYSKRASRIPWAAFQNQFGASYPLTTRGRLDFKRNFVLALKKVAAAYPEAEKLRVEPEYLVYIPGKPDVPPIVPSEK